MPLQFNRLGITPIVVFNFIIWLFFTLAYFYQIVYILRVMFKGEVKLPEAKSSIAMLSLLLPTMKSLLLAILSDLFFLKIILGS